MLRDKKTKRQSRRPAVEGFLGRDDRRAILATSKAVTEGHAADLDLEIMTRVLRAGFSLPRPELAEPMRVIAKNLPACLPNRDRRSLRRLAIKSGYRDVAIAL